MINWQELSQQLQQFINTIIRFVKVRRREEASIGLAAMLFYIGYNLIKWLPDGLQDWVKSWQGDRIIPGVIFSAGLIFLIYGIYRIGKLVFTPDLPPPTDRPSAIKGPLAFTQVDGELFRKLGREDELKKLLDYVEDDQVRLMVLMGASGAGKTSLLRAGLTDIIKDRNIKFHYWEAVPTDSGQALLRAIQESWKTNAEGNGNNLYPQPDSLEYLVNPSLQKLDSEKHIIVLDQFEQLRGDANGRIFKLLQKVARRAKPPHAITWIIAFRREFRADWSDFIIPEQEKGFYPPEISLRQFTSEQAGDVISQLIAAADLQVEDKVVKNLIEAATVEGEVSSVDIGIGLLILSELSARQGGKTITEEDYHFAGGAEGLLTQYIGRCLDNFPDEDRETIMNAMLTLRDAETNQRIAEGKTADEIADEIKTDKRRLKIHLERLTQRDIRLLEQSFSNDDNETRYRLPHERLIPAVNRLAGRLIGELEETKQKFVVAFSAWRKNKASQYLLKGKDLRLVKRYKSQIPWGKDEVEKLKFLKSSTRYQIFKRLTASLLIIFLLTGSWFTNNWYRQYETGNKVAEAKTFLRDSNYPPELYDYQGQLKVLELTGEFNTIRFPWLQSNTLEELTIKVTKDTNSLEGLVNSLIKCPAFKKLNLDISNSQINNLDILSNLNNLTELSLTISFKQHEVLSELSKLRNLAQFSLKYIGRYNILEFELEDSLINIDFLRDLVNLNHFSISGLPIEKIKSLSILKELKNLKEITLECNGSSKESIKFLGELINVKKLNLNLTSFYFDSGESVKKIKELENLNDLFMENSWDSVKFLRSLNQKKLNQLSLSFDYGEPRKISHLKKFTNFNHLRLEGLESDIKDLDSLKELTNLTQLSFAVDYDVKDLNFLNSLENLSQLTLIVTKNKSIELNFLKNLKNLSEFNLSIDNEITTHLDFLNELKNLDKISLEISDSQITNLELLQNLNCHTLKLGLNTDQRISLKTIPESVTHLQF